MAVLRRLILGGLLAGALVACGSGAPPEGSNATGQGLAEPTAIPQSEPVALRIPSIKLDTEQKWMPLGVQGERGVPVETVAGKKTPGAIQSPPVKQPQQLGWFCPLGLVKGCGWPTPGERIENRSSIVAAHVNGGGKPGVFARLHEVKAGDTIELDRRDGYTLTFTVTKAEIVPKEKVTVDMVYGPTPGAAPTIVLITCGGTLNRAQHRYEDQVLVHGELTGYRPKAA